jgi:CRP-like cAMP-binding protein
MTFLKFPFSRTEVMPVLMRHPVFAGASETALLPLLAQGGCKSLAKGEMLFHEQDVLSSWYLLLEGELESLRHGRDGEERIFCQIAAPELVAEVLMFIPGGQCPVSMRARTPCRLFQMRRQDLRQLCEREAQVTLRLLERASQRLSRRIDELEVLARASAPQRLAGYLLKLKAQQGEQIELPLNQRQLAATLGIRAETLNRLLSDWLQQGILQGSRRCWAVLAPYRLERIVAG